MKLHRILDSLKQYKTKLIKHTSNTIKEYNSTEQNMTQIKPNEPGKKENHLWVNLH